MQQFNKTVGLFPPIGYYNIVPVFKANKDYDKILKKNNNKFQF